MSHTFDGRYGIIKEFAEFAQSYQFDQLQLIAGCGFESRTTSILKQLSRLHHGNADCTIVDLMNRKDPNFIEAQKLQKPNMAKMARIAARHGWHLRTVTADLYSKRFVAHRALLNALLALAEKFSGDYLVDISCLPRSIVFPALRILWKTKRVKNLFVAFTDDPSVGQLEHQAEKYRAPSYVPFFNPEVTSSNFRVWLPILGDDYSPIKKIWNNYVFNDIYPVVGFPSSGPIETDEIVRKNKDIIFDRTDKVVFASMNDPFQLTMKLNMLIDEIRSSLGSEVRMIISPHGSKPQSVGAFMSAVIENASMLYCQPLSYNSMAGKVGQSHIYWLKGEAYRS